MPPPTRALLDSESVSFGQFKVFPAQFYMAKLTQTLIHRTLPIYMGVKLSEIFLPGSNLCACVHDWIRQGIEKKIPPKRHITL